MLTFDWEGYYGAVKNCENFDITLDPVFLHLQKLEKTRTIHEIFSVLKNISEQDCNKLNSPLLDFIKKCLESAKRQGRVAYAIKNKNLEAVKFLHKRSEYIPKNYLLQMTAIHGNLETLKYFMEFFKVTALEKHNIRWYAQGNVKHETQRILEFLSDSV